MMNSKLFTSASIGPLTLRNRTIRSAAFESMCPGNAPSRQLKDYHCSVAAGGVGMTTIAYAAVTQSGLSFDRQLWMRPEIIPGLREITDAVHEEWAEEVYRWLDDERSNLNKEVDGIIVVFGNLGLWNGRRQGYQILGSTIADILKSQCDDAEWYGDGYNIRGRMGHHDGTNYTLYRIAKDRDEAERIADKIYNREIDEEGFRRRTRSLYPYVAAVYGWKTRQRKPDKAA